MQNFRKFSITEFDRVLDTLLQCVKSVQIRSYFWPVFGRNTEIYSVILRIQSDYWKIRTRSNSVFGHLSRSGDFTGRATYIKHWKKFLFCWLKVYLSIKLKDHPGNLLYQTGSVVFVLHVEVSKFWRWGRITFTKDDANFFIFCHFPLFGKVTF